MESVAAKSNGDVVPSLLMPSQLQFWEPRFYFRKSVFLDCDTYRGGWQPNNVGATQTMIAVCPALGGP